MPTYPHGRGPTSTAARVIPTGSALAGRRFVAETLHPDHPCRPDAALLTYRLVQVMDTPLSMVITHAPRWTHLVVRPIGDLLPPGPPGPHDLGRALAGLDRRATRWGVTRERRRTSVWFELHAPPGDFAPATDAPPAAVVS